MSVCEENNECEEASVPHDPVLAMQEKFNATLAGFINNKSDNSNLFSKEKYYQLLKEVKETKQKNKKESVDYRRLKRFDVISVSGGEKLITPVKEAGHFANWPVFVLWL
jgi:hypothetical protein